MTSEIVLNSVRSAEDFNNQIGTFGERNTTQHRHNQRLVNITVITDAPIMALYTVRRGFYFILLTVFCGSLLKADTIEQAVDCTTDNNYCPCFLHDGSKIVCKGSYLKAVPMLAKQPQVYNELDLGKNQIRRLKSRAFGDLKVRNIKIWMNPLKSVSGDAFRGLEDVLEVVNLSEDSITTIPPLLFDNMHLLRDVDLSRNQLTELPENMFTGRVTMRNLNLAHNHLSNLTLKMLIGLDNLVSLRLEYNDISRIDLDAFRYMRYLEELDLRGNKISKLIPGLFYRMINLQSLYLNENKIAKLQTNTFEGLTFLKLLNLDKNEISYIAEGAFVSCRRLRELRLGKNKISGINAKMFRRLFRVEMLYLFNNELRKLQRGSFKYMYRLKVLNVENNSLTSISRCAFANLDMLDEVAALGNPLKCTCSLKWLFLQKISVSGYCQPASGEKMELWTFNESQKCPKEKSKC